MENEKKFIEKTWQETGGGGMLYEYILYKNGMLTVIGNDLICTYESYDAFVNGKEALTSIDYKKKANIKDYLPMMALLSELCGTGFQIAALWDNDHSKYDEMDEHYPLSTSFDDLILELQTWVHKMRDIWLEKCGMSWK